MHRIVALGCLAAGAVIVASAAWAQSTPPSAIVLQDHAVLRASPRDSARQQAVLAQGETLEVRGERLDYLQVYDHRRERAGYVRASQVRRLTGSPGEAPELLAVLRFVRETPGAEALGIGLVAAYFRAASPEALSGEGGIESLDALGGFATRLALRASSIAPLSKPAQATLAAHLEVASAYGVKIASSERDGRVVSCYDGEAFRRVLAMQSQPGQRARAALALTDPACIDPDLSLTARSQLDEWRSQVLERVDVGTLPAYLKNRVLMRRSGLAAALAYQQARRGEDGRKLAARALSEFAAIDKRELTDDDLAAYNDAAMRVSASRWAAVPAAALAEARGVALVVQAGKAGETCLSLVDAGKGSSNSPLATRCTFGIAWTASTSINPEGTALALAIQHTESWRELWVFRKDRGAWSVRAIPPSAEGPELGYAEFAGWVPGGHRMLVAKESRVGGKFRHAFEVVELDQLAVERQAGDPALLAAFRWQDPLWKRATLSLR